MPSLVRSSGSGHSRHRLPTDHRFPALRLVLRGGVRSHYRCGAAPDSHRIPFRQPQGLATATGTELLEGTSDRKRNLMWARSWAEIALLRTARLPCAEDLAVGAASKAAVIRHGCGASRCCRGVEPTVAMRCARRAGRRPTMIDDKTTSRRLWIVSAGVLSAVVGEESRCATLPATRTRIDRGALAVGARPRWGRLT